MSFLKAGASFALLQIRACAFGLLILALLFVSDAIWRPDWMLARYDFLLIAVLAAQYLMLRFGLESWEEARAIALFHIAGVVMELFKTAYGSWVYPGYSFFAIGGVPLFTGFMYSAVGSYMLRSLRLHEGRFLTLPPRWALSALALLIYVNFFQHHITPLPDFREILLAACGVVLGATWLEFRWGAGRARAPLLAFFMLAAGLLWVAENIGAFTNTWLYPHQMQGWRMIPVSKFGSWFLLICVSLALLRWAAPGAFRKR